MACKHEEIYEKEGKEYCLYCGEQITSRKIGRELKVVIPNYHGVEVKSKFGGKKDNSHLGK